MLLFGYTTLLGRTGVAFSKPLEEAFILPAALSFVPNGTVVMLLAVWQTGEGVQTAFPSSDAEWSLVFLADVALV